MRYLHDIITQWSGNSAVLQSPAITTPKKTYTYSDLQESVAQSIAYLTSYPELRPHAHVGIILGNHYETVVHMLACSMLDHPFVIINPTVKLQKLKQIVNDSPICHIISDSVEPELELIMDRNRQLAPHPDSAGLAALLYTSGSTGVPKGVMCTHSAMLAAIKGINEYLNHTPEDTILTVLPLSHGYGLYQVLTGLAAGAHVVLEPRFLFAQPILKRIQEVQATGFAVVPTMLTMIFKVDGWTESLDSLRYITNAGAALPPAYNLKLRQNLRDHTLIIPMHGLTECVRTLHMPNESIQAPLDAIGRPIPGVKLFIMDDNMKPVEMGQVGELVVCGPNVMGGYWGRPKETAETFVNLNGTVYLKSGDLFRQDLEHEYYYFVGRKDDVIKIRGERISPKEVEDIIYELEGVDQVVVVPVSDGIDYKLVAHVVSNKVDLTKNIILKWCKEHLESYMVPADVRFWDELPKNDNGKIDRKVLKAQSEV